MLEAHLAVLCEQTGVKPEDTMSVEQETVLRQGTAAIDELPADHPVRQEVDRMNLNSMRDNMGRLAERLVGTMPILPAPQRIRPTLWRQAQTAHAITFALAAPDRSDGAFLVGLEKHLLSIHDEDARSRAWAMLQARPHAERVYAMARWFEQGCPVIHLRGHKFAASLCATRPPPADQIGSPWRCWLLEIPSPLIEATQVDGSPVQITHLLVHANCLASRIVGEETKEVRVWNFTAMSEGNNVILDSIGFTLEESLAGDADNSSPLNEKWAFSTETNSQDDRALQIARRLAFNVCVALSSLDGDGSPTLSRPPVEKRARGEPDVGVFVFGGPTRIDCRESVQAYVRGASRSAPTVRFPVRGHWKPKLSARIGRSVWVEPYWKGEGPQLVHDRVVGEEEE